MNDRSPGRGLPLPGVRWRGLTVQLFATVIVPLTVVLVGVALGAVYLHQRAMRSLVGERDQRATASLARALEEQLHHRRVTLQSLALSLEDAASPGQALARAAFLREDYDLGLGVLDARGQVLAQTAWSTLAWGEVLRATGTSWWPREGAAFAPVFPRLAGEPMALVAAPAGEGRWVVGAFSIPALVRSTLLGTFAGVSLRVVLVAPDGAPLFLWPEDGRALDTAHPGVVAALQGETGVTYLPTAEGEQVVAFTPVRSVGWALVLEEAWEASTSPWLHTTQLAPLVLVPMVLLALLGLWFGAQRIVAPLQELERRAAALAWGDYQALAEPVGGIEEIQHLQHTLHHMAQKLRRAHESLRGYIGAITAGQEEERRRLARELHDDTLQSLIALQQRIQLARLQLAEHPQARQALAELQGVAEETIRDLRRVIRALRPLYLEDLGLVPTLEALVREIGQQHPDLQAEWVLEGTPRRLPAAQELALYRMAQEALNNVLRHARATWVQVRLAFAPRQVTLEVRDNGQGFLVPESPAEFAPQGHFGLLGMHERAELIGAHLSLESTPGQGTTVRVSLSLPEAPPPNGG